MGLGPVPPAEGVQLGGGLGARLRGARAARVRGPLTRRSVAPLVVLVVAAAFFSLGAAGRGLWESDEHRYAEVTRNMIERGDWVVPHLDGAPYHHKPPLFNWIAAACDTCFGMDLPLAVKVPGILGASAAVLAVFLVARRLYGAAAGVAAAVVLATCAEFDWIARTGHLDALLAGSTTLATWFFVRAAFPVEGETPRPALDTALGFLCAGLGLLTKGPVALVIPGSAILAFGLLAKESRPLFTRRFAWGLALAFVPVGIWLAAAASRIGWGYVHDISIGQALGHAAGEVDKVDARFWIYAVKHPVGLLPWTLFLPAAVLAATVWRRAGERRADLFTLAWTFAPLVAMSISPAKRAVYLVPVYAGSALLVARLATLDDERWRSWWVKAPRLLLGGAAVAGGLVAVAACLAATSQPHGELSRVPQRPPEFLASLSTGALAAGAALGLATSVAGLCALLGRTVPRQMVGLGASAVFASVFFAAVALPAMDPALSPRRFYGRVAAVVGDAPLARYGADDYASFWTLSREIVPLFKSREKAAEFLASQAGRAYLVSETDWLAVHPAPGNAREVFRDELMTKAPLVLLERSTR